MKTSLLGIICCLVSFPAIFCEGKTPMMPLSEIEVGMEGEWHTVVSGTEVETFRLKIIGIVDNFAGPQRSVIMAEALDTSQLLNGPVQGMSGSPVYIEGKLIGAYAYGFPWAKEQTLVGITPIEHMLEILDKPEQPAHRRSSLSPSHAAHRDQFALGNSSDWQWRQTEQQVPGSPEWKKQATEFRPLPTPVMASGISARTLAAFEHEIAARGLKILQAPSGSSGEQLPNDFKPGSAVAAVMMDGDFSFSGVGTVTWREGDKILAFGHPMSLTGASAVPMAPAEVLTIVRNLEISYKMSRIGQTEGVIYQDRLTGIAGKIGGEAVTTPVRFSVESADGTQRLYQGNVFEDPSVTPLLTAIALSQSLSSTLETAQEQTFSVAMTMQLTGHEPLTVKNTVSGAGSAFRVAIDFMAVYDLLLNNPFGVVPVESVDFDIKVEDRWRQSYMRKVQLLSGEVREGEDVRIAFTLENYLSEPKRHVITVPIPEGVSGQRLDLLLVDGESADSIDKGRLLNTSDSVAGVIDSLRNRRSGNAVYVKLLQSTKGLRLRGKNLPDLPPSVRALIGSRRSNEPIEAIKQKTIWETEITLPGEFQGSYSLPLEVK